MTAVPQRHSTDTEGQGVGQKNNGRVGLVKSVQNSGNLNLYKEDFIVEAKIKSHAGRNLELPNGTKVSERPRVGSCPLFKETHSTDVAQVKTSFVTEFFHTLNFNLLFNTH